MSMGFGTRPEAPMSDKEKKHLKALKEAGFTDKQINKMRTRKGGGLKPEQVNIKGVKSGTRGGGVITIGGGKLTDTEKEQRKNLRNLRGKTVTEKKEAARRRAAAAAKKKKDAEAKRKEANKNKANGTKTQSNKTKPSKKVKLPKGKTTILSDLIKRANRFLDSYYKQNAPKTGRQVVPVKPKPKRPGTDVVPSQSKPKRLGTTTTPKTGTKTGTNTRQGSVPKSSRPRVNRELKTGTSPNIRPRDLAIKTGLATLGGTIAGQKETKPKKSPLSGVTPPRKPKRGYKAPFKMEDPTFSKPKPRVDTFKDMPKKKKKTLAAAKKAGDNMRVPAAKKKNERYRYYGKPGETIGDLSRKFEIKYDTKPQAMLPHEEGYESNKRGGQIKGYKHGGKVKGYNKGGKVSRPRGVGCAMRGYGKAMK